MITRRQFVGRGLGAIALGYLARPTWSIGPAQGPIKSGGQAHGSDPIAALPYQLQSVVFQDLPFAEGFTGDGFPAAGDAHVEVPPFMAPLEEADLPEPAETVTVAVVGGGLSGLGSAYLLRDLRPVLLDMHDHFGGAARGESWQGAGYSLGNAYVITPDKGTFLDDLYRELGLDEVYRLSEGGEDPIAVDGNVLEDFWTNGLGGDPDEVAALAEYADVVSYMADKGYPCIPYNPADKEYVFELDQKTLKQDIEDQMTLPVPPLLESAIQGYCFSSFGAGWEQVSAAGGWNFLAAEEYGRWVFPAGTAYMAHALWKKLRAVDQQAETSMLRAGATVVDVRMAGKHVRVTYRDRTGTLRGLLAERVVMACPKFVCKHIMHGLSELDGQKFDAMHLLTYTPYAVVNVLLDRALTQDFYDTFLLGDSAMPLGSYNPCGTPFKQDESPVTDVLNGFFATPDQPRSVLTMYWPLMCATARYELVFADPWTRWAERFAVQLDGILALLGLTRENVVQVRMSRWGHAMPMAAPNLIAGGTVELLRRPIEDRIYFVNQDNWALPAVENSLLDAEIMTGQLLESLGG